MTKPTLSLGLIIALIGFPQISETIYTPALPSVSADLHASAQWVESSLAIYFAGFAAGVSLWGGFSDWSGRRIAMLLGLLIYFIATLGCGNASSIEALLTWRFVQAFGASVGSVITQTIIRDSFEGIERAKIFSFLTGALAFSPAIGPVVGGVISESLGWRGNFWILTLMAVILIIWSFRFLPESCPKNHARPTLKQMKRLTVTMTSSLPLLGHVLLIGSTNGIIFSFYQEAPFIFINQLGMSASHYGLLGILIAASSILAARLSYCLVKTYSPESVIWLGSSVTLAGALLFSLSTLFGEIRLDVLGMAAPLGGLAAIFLGVGLVIPNSLSLALKPYTLSVGMAGSIFGCLYYCLVAGFTWMMSFLHNGTAYALPFYILSLGTVLIAGCWMIECRTKDTENSAAKHAL